MHNFSNYEGDKALQKRTSHKAHKQKKRMWFLVLIIIICTVVAILAIREIVTRVINEKTIGNEVYDENNIGQVFFYQTESEHIVTDANGVQYADNEILLVADDSVSYDDIEQLAESYNAEIVGWIEQTGDYQLKFVQTYSATELEDIKVALESDDRVISAYIDYAFNISSEKVHSRDGFMYGAEWENDLQNFNNCKGKSWGIEAIEVLAAWDILNAYSTQVNPVRIGLIDGGFDVEHEDLGFAETFYNSISAHGTHVAGTMAAKATNQEGICGVYPYGDGNLYGVSYMGVCSYSENGNPITTSMFLKIAYSELILRNVKVINSSLGFNYYKWPLSYMDSSWETQVDFLESNAYILADFLDRLLDKGYDFVLVTAAGNDSERSKNIVYDSKYSFWTTVIDQEEYPRVYDRIIVVGAVDSKLNICDFSNGGERVDIYAPGEKIFSTIPNNKYENNSWSGTSMAAPHVSGVAAMVWSLNNKLTGSQVKEIVCKCKSFRCTSCKMVDAYIALEAALNTGTESEGKWAENGGILCWVVDLENEEIKIENALVTATNVENGMSHSVYTDNAGHFEFILPEGKYLLSVKADGYEDFMWPGDNEFFSNPITVKVGGVNYLEDWIKLKKCNTNEGIFGTYSINESKTNDKNESPLWGFLGNGIQYGYEMILKEDGTASWFAGIGNGGEGTYNFIDSNGKLTYFDYEDGSEKTVTVSIIEDDGKNYLIMNCNEYTLYWEKIDNNTIGSRRLSRVNYYNFDGTLVYYDSYAYYDNGLLCSKTLHSVNYSSNGTTYFGDEYTFLYLYDDNGNLRETVLDALTISEWYDKSTGEITLGYEYDLSGNSRKLTIYPEKESIEQEKYGIDPKKTEKIYGMAMTIPTDSSHGWASAYLSNVFEGDEPTDMTTCRLIYVDDNRQPELWIDYGYGYAGAEVYTTANGKTDYISLSHGVVYWKENSNLLLVTGGHMDVYYNIIYKIENGKFVVVMEGNYGDINNSSIQYDENGYPIYEYHWEDNIVTEEEYEQNLSNSFEMNNTVDINQNIYTYDQCKLILQYMEGI